MKAHASEGSQAGLAGRERVRSAVEGRGSGAEPPGGRVSASRGRARAGLRARSVGDRMFPSLGPGVGGGKGSRSGWDRDPAKARGVGWGWGRALLPLAPAGEPRSREEGAARAGERQRPPRRGRGRCLHVRDSVRTVPGPVPAGRVCAVCLRPRAAGVRVCSLASVLGILPGACARGVPCACVSPPARAP